MVCLLDVYRIRNSCSFLTSGDLLYLDAVGQPIVIINDPEIASSLLEKRSAIYSSRMQSRLISL